MGIRYTIEIYCDTCDDVEVYPYLDFKIIDSYKFAKGKGWVIEDGKFVCVGCQSYKKCRHCKVRNDVDSLYCLHCGKSMEFQNI